MRRCHNREYECQYCGRKGTYTKIMEAHDNICKEKLLFCPNNECAIPLKRARLEKHLESECKHAVISCKYKTIGCDVKMKRKDTGAHEQEEDKLHLNKALDTVAMLENNLQTAKGAIASLKGSYTLKRGESLTFKVTVFEKKKENNEIVYSPSFIAGVDGYNMQVKVYPNGNGTAKGTHISVFVCILEGVHDDRLSWPFIGEVTAY